MQTITVHQEPSAVVLGMPDFGPGLYAHDKGVDHPTPPAPDPRKTGSKPPPAPAPTKVPEPDKKK
jgi:hypothetical protein